MSINKLARKLYLKYAEEFEDSEEPEIVERTKMELFDPSASAAEQMELFRNNLISLYEKFIAELDGEIAKIQGAFNLPLIDKIHGMFAELIGSLKKKNRIHIHSELADTIKAINKVRSSLNDFVKTNVDDPLFTAFHMRKKVASTVERVLVNFQKQLRDMQVDIASTTKKNLKPTEVDKRRPMAQTIEKGERLRKQYGDYFGVHSREAMGKLWEKDSELAKELVSAFMGLDLLTDKSESNIRKQVFMDNKKVELIKRIKEVLNPTLPLGPMPYGKLPLKPPGRG